MKSFAALDSQTTQQLCRRGLKLVSATGPALGALRAAVQPVYAALTRDPETRQAIAEIRSIKSGLGSSGATSISRCGGNTQAVSGQSSPIDGTYHSTVTRAQLLSNPKFEPGEDNPSNYGHFTLTIHHGRFEWRGSADGIPEGGTVTVRADRLTLRPTYPADAVGQTFAYRWSLYRGLLSLTKLPPGGPTFLVAHPWDR